MFDGAGFSAERHSHEALEAVQDLSSAGRIERVRTIVSLAQRTLRGAGLPLLNDCEHSILSEPYVSEALGVRPLEAQKVRAVFSSIGREVALVGHRNPDDDCVAGVLIVRHLLEAAGIRVRAYASGNKEYHAPGWPGQNHDGPVFHPVAELPEGVPFILIDAPDSAMPHVGVPSERRPVFVIDTHSSETNGVQALISNRHAAVSSIMLSLLFDKYPPDDQRFRSPEMSKLVTQAFLGIMTDTSMLRRATQHDVEAVRAALPFIDQEMLKRHNHSVFEVDLRALFGEIKQIMRSANQPGSSRYYLRENDFLVCALGKQPPERHEVIAAAADEICLGSGPGGPLCALMLYQEEREKAVTGILRANETHPLYERFNISQLVEWLFPDNQGGSRNGSVGGGRIRGLSDPDMTQRNLVLMFRLFAQGFSGSTAAL